LAHHPRNISISHRTFTHTTTNMSPKPSPSIRTLLATLLLAIPSLAQTTYVQGTFQAAISASSNGQPDLTSAASAVCPANFPQSCSSIGEAGLYVFVHHLTILGQPQLTFNFQLLPNRHLLPIRRQQASRLLLRSQRPLLWLLIGRRRIPSNVTIRRARTANNSLPTAKHSQCRRSSGRREQ
jgi:hypothetical protein